MNDADEPPRLAPEVLRRTTLAGQYEEAELLVDEDEPLPPRERPVVVPHDTVLPPAPPGTRHVRVPRLGIIIADDDLRERVERRFHWPMILLALAVLPLLAVEVMKKPVGSLALWVDIGFGVIWFAFLVEFIVKITIAESRFEYVRRNWLDLVIILVPLLRPLRLSSLTRTIRLFKLRGVGLKLLRSVIMLFVSFEMADRLLRRFGIERKKEPGLPAPRKMTRQALMDEVDALRGRVEAWETWYGEHTLFLEDQGVLTYDVPDEIPAEAVAAAAEPSELPSPEPTSAVPTSESPQPPSAESPG